VELALLFKDEMYSMCVYRHRVILSPIFRAATMLSLLPPSWILQGRLVGYGFEG
jgi:hypothetical protein